MAKQPNLNNQYNQLYSFVLVNNCIQETDLILRHILVIIQLLLSLFLLHFHAFGDIRARCHPGRG